MSRKFAEKYTEYVGYKYKKNGTCENPLCGHFPIHRRFTLRNPNSGDTVEVGADCCISWCQFHNRPIPPEAGIQYQSAERKYRKMHGTTSGFAEEWFETQRRKRIKKELDLVLCDVPIEAFETAEKANEAAKKYDGYCECQITRRGKKFWAVYIPKELRNMFISSILEA